MTRIIGGQWGGRRIAVPRHGAGGRGTRPTTDRVREAVFGALDARLDFSGATVLDLYAGSGALGLEALSRGAARAVFVESDRRAAAVLRENAAALGATGAQVRCAPVARVLAATPGVGADLVFADPPYGLDAPAVEEVLAALGGGGWVSPGAVAVLERGVAGRPVRWPAGWTALPARCYGDTRIEWAGRDPEAGA